MSQVGRVSIRIKRTSGAAHRLSVADISETRAIVEPDGFDPADFNKVYARQFVERLELGAHDRLQAGDSFHLLDRNILENALKKLRAEFDALEGILDEPMRASNPNSLRAAYANLQQIMEKCFDLGAAGVIPISAKKELNKENTAPGRRKKSLKVAENHEKLVEAVRLALNEQTGRKISVSDECAGQIQLSVRSNLGLPPKGKGYPSIKAIRGAIKTLKNRVGSDRASPLSGQY